LPLNIEMIPKAYSETQSKTRGAVNICPQCGTDNRPEARFCKQCAFALPQCAFALPQCAFALPQCARVEDIRPALPQHQSALPSAAALTCPHCGATLRPGARFCKQCGKPVTATDAAATHSTCPHCGAPTRPGARFCRTCSRPLSTAPPPPGARPPTQQPGRFGTGNLLPLTILINRYVILEKIAQGGMGAVYKAQDRRLQGKVVAVKEMSESVIALTERKRILGSFQREAELLARLEHPNLVRVTDCFQEEERHYMVMEFIEGRTLEKMLAGRTDMFSEEQVLVWASQLCDVLSYLHSQEPKIIYRDVKPANAMVLDGIDTVKLIDFGIARFFKLGKRKDTMEFGTYGYAPPEQYGKSQTDERADIYALGAMLHQLLTLRDPVTRPFHFPPVHSLNPKVSRRVEAAIMKAVKGNKDKRHQSIKELWEALLGEIPARPRRAAPGPAIPSPIPGVLTTAPVTVDFSKVMVGDRVADRSVVVNFPAGEQATLDTDTPWLQVHPRSISKSGGQITVTLDTARLKPGRLRLRGGWLKRWVGWHTRFLVPAEQKVHAHIEIESESGHRQRVPISVTVVPQPWRVLIGWIMAIGATLLEMAAVVGALGILATMVALETVF